MGQEDDDHWIIRIPKPKRLMRRIVASMAGFAESKISVDVPMMVMTALFIGVVSFIIFNLLVRI
ncbi:MAG: hypothetical protein QW815_02760, partial [Nitrososphaerota archaeon]